MKKKLFILAMAALLTATMSAQALELDAPEQISDNAEEIVALADADVSTYHPTYGDLIYYQDFSDDYITPTYSASGVTVSIGGDIQAKYSIDVNPYGLGNVLGITATSGFSGYNIDFNGYSAANTTVTIVLDYYLPSETLTAVGGWYRLNGTNGAGWDQITNNSPKDQWFTKKYTFSGSVTEITKLEFRNNTAQGDKYYIDNVYVYAKTPLAENQIIIANGDKYEKAELSGSTYTFPAIGKDETGVYARTYIGDNGNRYMAGTEYNSSEIGGATYTVCDVTVPMIDENLGELVMFHSFENGKKNVIEYYNNEVLGNVTWSNGQGLSFNDSSVVDAYDADGKALEMTLKSGAAYKISGFQYSFNPQAPALGKYSTYMDVYNRNEGTALDRAILIGNDGGELGDYSYGSSVVFAKDAWTRNVKFRDVTVKANTDEATKDTKAYDVGWDFIQNHTHKKTNKFSYLQFRFNGESKASVSVDNVKIYFYPANAFMLKVNGKLEMVQATESYTFEAVEGVTEFTDGENFYKAGDTVKISKLAGKTVVEAETANNEGMKIEGSYYFPATGNSMTTGVRYTALFPKTIVKNANEFGFIVAKSLDLSTDDDHENALTFDLADEGIKLASAWAYKDGEYNGEATADEKGNVYMNARLVGADPKNGEHVHRKFTIRTYAKLKTAGNNEITAYSIDVRETSLLETAMNVKDIVDDYGNITDEELKQMISEAGFTGAEAEEVFANTRKTIDECKASYEEASYDGGNHIDDIIALKYYL